MEATSTPWGGVSAPSAGSSRVGACLGPRTSRAVLMLGPPDRGGLGPAEHMRRSWQRSRNSKRPLERRRWLGYWQGSWRPERRRERDILHCEGIMRQCGPLRTSAGSGLRCSSCTSALPKLHLRLVCSPIYPQRVCAYLSRGPSFSLVHCLWLAWQCLAGFFGCGLVRCLGSAWGLCQSRYGFGSGIPKLVKRASTLALSRPGRIDIVKPYFTGRRPRACGQVTIYSLGAVHGWSTSSWKSWALRLGGTAVGILCAGVAALRVTLATLSCSSSSGGGVGAVSGPLCGMRQRSKMRQSWAPLDCLRSPARGGATGVLTHLEVCGPQDVPIGG